MIVRVFMPLVLIAAALLIGIYSVGSDLGSTDAAQCNEDINKNGKVAGGTSAMFQLTFCSNPTDSFAAYLSWNRFDADRDLAMRVTSPDGQTWLIDTHDGAGESFIHSAPLPEGDWTVEIINNGSRNVRFSLLAGFG